MKKLCRALALCTALGLVSVPTVFAADAAGKSQSEAAPTAPRAVLMTWDADTGTSGQQKTPSFQMKPGDGEYLRWYFANDSRSSPAHVYLYDVGKGEIVSAMSPRVDPGEERTEVYFVGSDSSYCQFAILAESMDGASVTGLIRARQIQSAQ